MSFLAIARQKSDNVDTGKYQHNELNSFKIQFEVQIPTAGGSYKKVTQTTRPVQAGKTSFTTQTVHELKPVSLTVCPNKMTRLRKMWKGELESPTKRIQSPSKNFESRVKRIKFN